MSESLQRFHKARQEAESRWREPIERRCGELVAQAEAMFDATLKCPDVEFTQRGTIAGSARLQSNLIRLHPVLLCEHSQEFLDQILAHEVAHLLVHQLYGLVAPHGAQWRQMMTQVFELPAHRTHQLDVTHLQGKSFDYACGCQVHKLTIRRHNKVLKGARYRCRGCGQELVASFES